MSDQFDLAIVGGGPGGSTAAAYASRAGLRTLLVDKATFPRDKSCGDAVCTKSVRILKDLGLNDKVEKETFASCNGQVLVGFNGEGLQLPFFNKARNAAGAVHSEPAPVYVIRRERFDNVLFQHAKSLPGVTALEGFSFGDMLREGDAARGIIGTDKDGQEKRYRASAVIGADGAISRVAAKVGAYDFKNKAHDHWIGAFRTYYRGVAGLTDNMEIHFVDELLPGYFWIFPVGNGEANVGAGMVETFLQGKRNGAKIDLRKRTLEIISRHPRFRGRFAGAEEVRGSFRGWQLPCGSERRTLAGKGWMLIGDAASLIDPFSGEGISNAMHSARLAVEVAATAVRDGTAATSGLQRYQDKVWEELGDELATAHKLQRLARHKWLLDFVLRAAAKRPKIRAAALEIMGDPEAARQLLRPGFYMKLLFS